VKLEKKLASPTLNLRLAAEAEENNYLKRALSLAITAPICYTYQSLKIINGREHNIWRE